MKWSEFKNLDPNNIGSWPGVAKGVVLGMLVVLVLAAGYWFDWQNQMGQLDSARQKEVELKKTFAQRQARAANLEPLKAQIEEMKQSFGAMLRLLPNKTEIEGLLVDISQAGLSAGLEFELFKPQPEKPAEFYAVKPINIRVDGTYHQFGEFVSAVAALPRIVTVQDISISPKKDPKRPGLLQMDMVAKTYRYVDASERKGGHKKGRKGKR